MSDNNLTPEKAAKPPCRVCGLPVAAYASDEYRRDIHSSDEMCILELKSMIESQAAKITDLERADRAWQNARDAWMESDKRKDARIAELEAKESNLGQQSLRWRDLYHSAEAELKALRASPPPKDDVAVNRPAMAFACGCAVSRINASPCFRYCAEHEPAAPPNAYQAEQVEILRRIAERGLKHARGVHEVHANNSSIDLWQHMLDEIQRLRAPTEPEEPYCTCPPSYPMQCGHHPDCNSQRVGTETKATNAIDPADIANACPDCGYTQGHAQQCNF